MKLEQDGVLLTSGRLLGYAFYCSELWTTDDDIHASFIVKTETVVVAKFLHQRGALKEKERKEDWNLKLCDAGGGCEGGSDGGVQTLGGHTRKYWKTGLVLAGCHKYEGGSIDTPLDLNAWNLILSSSGGVFCSLKGSKIFPHLHLLSFYPSS